MSLPPVKLFLLRSFCFNDIICRCTDGTLDVNFKILERARKEDFLTENGISVVTKIAKTTHLRLCINARISLCTARKFASYNTAPSCVILPFTLIGLMMTS